MLRTRWSRIVSVAALCGGLTAIGAGVAIAHDESNSPTTTPVMATFHADLVKTHLTTCTGTDGTYHQDQSSFTGTSTSSDPRLNGNITIASRSLVNITTGYGTSTGEITLRDSKTNKVLAQSVFTAVNTHNGVLHGIQVGRVAKTTTLPAGTLVANFSAVFNNPGTAFDGTLGQNTDSAPPPQQPAVIQSGSCGNSDPEK